VKRDAKYVAAKDRIAAEVGIAKLQDVIAGVFLPPLPPVIQSPPSPIIMPTTKIFFVLL